MRNTQKPAETNETPKTTTSYNTENEEQRRSISPACRISFINDVGYARIYTYLFFSRIFILLSREKAIKALKRGRLGVAGHVSTTPRWGNPAKCLC